MGPIDEEEGSRLGKSLLDKFRGLEVELHIRQKQTY